ncbi:MAG TPA: RluA family pseudouridine synthase [Clostridiaceae bacterium]|nr:RluA family pseudouridine synthase [Clostridiaceae bacterium]
MDIRILYEDNHLLVVVKPPNMPVQGDISGDMDLLTLLKADIKKRYNKPGNVFLGLVHRLDRPVGGVMVFARTSKAASRLSEQVRKHETEKIYLCVTQGCPKELKGRLSDHLLKDEKENVVKVVEPGTPGSKPAVLEYEVMAQRDGLSLVRVNLITGRSHQVRVQMSNNGTPLFGDTKYGYAGDRGHQLALWSHKLSIFHPTTKERMTFTSSPPDTYPWNLFSYISLS